MATAHIFREAAAYMLNQAKGLHNIVPVSRSRALFGVQPHTCVTVFNNIWTEHSARGTLTHFLWVSIFLEVYASEYVHCCLDGVDRNNFRKWLWYYVTLISSLKYVCDHKIIYF